MADELIDVGSKLTEEELELFAKLLDFYQNYELYQRLPLATKAVVWQMVYQLCRKSAAWVAAFFGIKYNTARALLRNRGLKASGIRARPPWDYYYDRAAALVMEGKVKPVLQELREEMLGGPYDPKEGAIEALREARLKQQAAQAQAKQPTEQLPNEENEDEGKEDILPNEDVAKLDYYRARCAKLERRLERLQQQYIRLQMTWERFSEYVLEKLAPYPKQDYPDVPPARSTKDPHIAMMDLSDIHVGELVRAEETMGLAAYDWETFLRRKKAYMEGLVRVVEDVREDHPIHIGIIHALGDWATGERNFPLQLAQLDKFLNEQIIEGSAELAEMIQFMATLFPKLYIYAVPGNHSAGKDLTMTLDLLVYHTIATLLRDQDNIKFVISKSPYLGYELSPQYVPIEYKHDNWCWRYLITHGHMVRRHYGIPYYGLDRLVAKITKTTGVVWDAVFAAHHHEEARTRHWWVNGSWVGGSKLSVEKMQAAEPACQWFRLWHPHWGISWQLEIYLENPQQKLMPDEDGIFGPAFKQ
ncbi:MAG: hypothetical protein JRD89_00165 [Deltaproteobacteria bacterium]|nr:hypothetical protein [Deltaproteobacteria bacterium]